jgi:hypothetical protein
MRVVFLKCFNDFLFLTVTAHELVDTTCGVYKLLFTGVKRVRFVGDFEFVKGILVSIFPFGGFFGVYTAVY